MKREFLGITANFHNGMKWAKKVETKLFVLARNSLVFSLGYAVVMHIAAAAV